MKLRVCEQYFAEPLCGLAGHAPRVRVLISERTTPTWRFQFHQRSTKIIFGGARTIAVRHPHAEAIVVAGRRIVLAPRAHLAYGQDFTRQLTQSALSLEPVEVSGGAFQLDLSGVGLIIAHDLENSDIAAAIQSVPGTVPIVGHVHLQWSYCGPDLKERLAASLARVRLGITPADFLRAELSSRFPDIDWCCVRNGVDGSLFRVSSPERRNAWRDSIGVPPDATLLAYVGRLENAKGLQILRAAATSLGDYGYHLVIQYPSWSSMPPRYEARASLIKAANPERVHLAPDRNPASERPIRCCDCLFHPSLSEVAPRTVIESWMSGVPVVVARSTPFLDEVPRLDLATQVVDLPQELGLEKLDRTHLSIDDEDVTRSIARDMFARVPRFASWSDAQRLNLATLARLEGFGAEEMVESLRRTYEQVA